MLVAFLYGLFVSCEPEEGVVEIDLVVTSMLIKKRCSCDRPAVSPFYGEKVDHWLQ